MFPPASKIEVRRFDALLFEQVSWPSGWSSEAEVDADGAFVTISGYFLGARGATASILTATTLACSSLTVTARAADAPVPGAGASPLPIFAQAPETDKASPWTGLYAGSEVFGVGGRHIKGGFGGDAFAGYNREFSNNLVIGIQGSTGYTPSLFSYSAASGYEFATVDLKAGVDMGRFMPYVTAGIGLAKPNLRTFGYSGATGTVNDLFNDTSNLLTVGSVGAGVDYKITNNFVVGVSVSAIRGAGAPALP